MHPFWQWLRAEIAPDGLPDPVLAFSAGAFAWCVFRGIMSMDFSAS